jgi:hypothetical protein
MQETQAGKRFSRFRCWFCVCTCVGILSAKHPLKHRETLKTGNGRYTQKTPLLLGFFNKNGACFGGR